MLSSISESFFSIWLTLASSNSRQRNSDSYKTKLKEQQLTMRIVFQAYKGGEISPGNQNALHPLYLLFAWYHVSTCSTPRDLPPIAHLPSQNTLASQPAAKEDTQRAKEINNMCYKSSNHTNLLINTHVNQPPEVSSPIVLPTGMSMVTKYFLWGFWQTKRASPGLIWF